MKTTRVIQEIAAVGEFGSRTLTLKRELFVLLARAFLFGRGRDSKRVCCVFRDLLLTFNTRK